MIYDIKQITKALDIEQNLEKLLQIQKQAFIDFSSNLYEVPIPMQLKFHEFTGDCHVKSGFKKDDDLFVIKVATGFYKNTELGLPSGDGALLLMSQKTGLLQAILCDGGYLTTLRTALAAMVAAKITPWDIRCIGIVGTGKLASQLLYILQKQFPLAQICLWGRNVNKAKTFADENIIICNFIDELCALSDVIITTTASTEPVISTHAIGGRKHIIALGADDIDKQECSPCLFRKADVVIVDSCKQACVFGDTFHAISANVITIDKVIELGNVLQAEKTLDAKLIVTDLTGIAAQDVAIAIFVLQQLKI